MSPLRSTTARVAAAFAILLAGFGLWLGLRHWHLPVPVESRPSGLRVQEIPGETLMRWSPATTASRRPLATPRPSGAAVQAPLSSAAHSAFRMDRGDILKKKGDSYAYNTRDYGATFAKGGVDFGLPYEVDDLGQPLISYTLEAVRCGDAVLATGTPAAPSARPDRREVYFDRGQVEEVYALRPEGVEQSFILHSLPEGRGAITIEGALKTSLAGPAADEPAETLVFGDGRRERIRVSKAIVKDAKGRELALAMRYADGRMSMTVPAGWVAEAALPIVVDPLIGAASPYATDLNVQNRIYRASDVAYGSVQNAYFVVWNENIGADVFSYDAYGHLISGSGALLGGVLTLGSGPGWDDVPSVCYAPSVDRFLVTWTGMPIGGSQPVLLSRLIHGNGAPVGDTFMLDGRAARYPTAAFDGTNWLVVFGENTANPTYSLRARFVDSNGIPGATLDVDADGDSSALGKIAFASNRYLVTWTKMVQDTPLYACTLSPAGDVLTPRTVVPGSAGQHVFEDHALHAGGDRFLITWTHSGTTTLQGRIIDAALYSVAPPMTIETAAWSVGPDLAYSATNGQWIVAYVTGFPEYNYEVYLRRISPDGTFTAAERLTQNTAPNWAPDLAWTSVANEALVVYHEGYSPSQSLIGQRVDLTPQTSPPAPTALTVTGTEWHVHLSWAAAPGATHYNVKRGTQSGVYTTTFSGVSATTYTDLNPGLGIPYFYVVTAANSFGESGPSSEVQGTALPPVPVAPRSLVATPLDGAVDLTWNGPVTATHYAVKRSLTSGGPYAAVATGLTTMAYRDTGLENGRTYYYVVNCSNLGGTSPDSAQAQATPKAASAEALLIVGNTLLGTGDTAVEARLRALGFSTLVRDAAAVAPIDAAGKALVVISSTVASGSVNTKFRGVSIPVLTWESALLDDLGMTGTVSGTDLGTLGAQTALAIADAAHPLAAGLSGTPVVSTSSIYSWGVPGPAAAKVVTLAGNSARAAIFGYEAGAAMPGLAAPARRVGFFLEDITAANLTADGLKLFDAAVLWAVGSSAGATVPPSGLAATGGNAQVSLAWNPVAGATSYTLKRGTSTSGPYVPVATGLTGTSHVDLGLTNDQTYYYVIAALKGGVESGPSNEAFATPRFAAPLVLFVVGNLSLGAGDEAVKARLEGLGFSVVAKTAASSTGADALGKSLVVVSSTVTSGDVANKFRTSSVPVVTWESALYDDFGMTGPTAATDFGTQGAQSGIAITSPALALAAGLSGTPAVTQAPAAFSWGVPGPAALTAGVQPGTPARALVFGYEAGTVMPGLVAPARRVGLFLEDLTASLLTPSGWALFDAAVRWASNATPGAPAAPTELSATPGTGQVTLAWTESAGAMGYRIKRAPQTGGPYATVATGVTGSLYVDAGLSDGTYYYVVTAEAGALESPASNEAIATLAAAGRPALFVVGPTAPLGAGDLAVQARLAALGYAVTVKTGSSTLAADADGKALVVISSTITSSTVNTKFRASAVPVLNWENALYDDLGMAGPGSGVDYGTMGNQSTVLTVDPAHPLSAGLSGTVAVTTQAQIFSWAVPGATAARAADLAFNPGRAAIFGYEAGAAMPGLAAAPARRVGFFLEDLTAASLNANGWALFDAAVRWAVGDGIQGLPPAPPTGLSGSVGPTGAVLSWSANGEADLAGYRVYRASAPGGPYADPLNASLLSAPGFVDPALPPGTSYYVVRAVDTEGLESLDSAPVAVTRDALPPPAPVIQSPTHGTTLTDAFPTISGTSSGPGLTITLLVDGDPRGSATSGFGGSWSTTPSVPGLAGGTRTLTATATNSAGTSAPSAAVVVTVSLTVADTSAPVISDVAPAGFVGTRRPTFSGRFADSGGSGLKTGTLRVRLNGVYLPASVSQPGPNDAELAASIAFDLSEGAQGLVFEAQDNALNATEAASSFVVDTTPPALVVRSPLPGGPYPSPITLDASASDAGSGIGEVRVYLNGSEITSQLIISGGPEGEVTLTGGLLAVPSTNVLQVAVADRAQNPAAADVVFTASGTATPPIELPDVIADIDAVTTLPPSSGGPSAFTAPTRRSTMIQVRATVDGQNKPGVLIAPRIVEGEGEIFFTSSHPQVSGEDGVAGFGLRHGRKPGSVRVVVEPVGVGIGRTASFDFLATIVSPGVPSLPIGFPGGVVENVLVTSTHAQVGRTVIVLEEVDASGALVTNPADKKLEIPCSAVTTEEDGRYFMHLRLSPSTPLGSTAYLRATWPEFGTSTGDPVTLIVPYAVANTPPRLLIVSGSEQVANPDQPLPGPIVARSLTTLFEGERRIMTASLSGPGSLRALSGTLIHQAGSTLWVDLDQGDTLAVEYTGEDLARSAMVSFTTGKSFGPPSGPPFGFGFGGQAAVVRAPQLGLKAADLVTDLPAVPISSLDRSLTESIPATDCFYVEARLPEGLSDTVEVLVEALDESLQSLPDDGLFPSPVLVVALARQGGVYRSGPLRASSSATLLDSTPSLAFQVFRMAHLLRLRLNGGLLPAVQAQQPSYIQVTTTPEIAQGQGPPNDFRHLVNGMVNIIETPGQPIPSIQIQVSPAIHGIVPTLSGRVSEPGRGMFKISRDRVVAAFSEPAGENTQITFQPAPPNPLTGREVFRLILALSGGGLPQGDNEVHVYVNIARLAGTVRVFYWYVLTAGELPVTPQVDKRLQMARTHEINNKIWAQAGIRLQNMNKVQSRYFFLSSPPLEDIVAEDEADEFALSDYATTTSTHATIRASMNVFYVDTVTSGGALIGGVAYPFAPTSRHRFAVSTKAPLRTMGNTDSHAAHEIGHLLRLSDLKIPAPPNRSLNVNNLMMNKPMLRLSNGLNTMAQTLQGGFEDQFDISRTQATFLNDP